MSTNIKTPKKLIEVALPLDDINSASAYEKLPGIGAHPRGIHHWWARRPFGAARAIIFAQMVNDPGGQRGYFSGKTKAQAEAEREKLFEVVRQLADWKNTDNQELLDRAYQLIEKSWQETCELNKGNQEFYSSTLPAFHDPFAGGGALPAEAQRLGLEAYASDLNPVAVMINKAMIEIPSKFSSHEPLGPIPEGVKQKKLITDWRGSLGLAEDIRRYGHALIAKAKSRIGYLYPYINITKEIAQGRSDVEKYIGKDLKVIAYIWARTVRSPNPAFNKVEVPLISSFILSTKKGKEAWIDPVIDNNNYRFEVRTGKPPKEAKTGTKTGRGANFSCLMSGTPFKSDYIKEEGVNQRIGRRLMAIVVEGTRERIYLSPLSNQEAIANDVAKPDWSPNTALPDDPRNFWTVNYGLTKYEDLFTIRQLVAFDTFADLIDEIREVATKDAINSGMQEDGASLYQGGEGATAYGQAIAVFLSFALDRATDFNNVCVGWNPSNEKVMHLFNRQAIPMVWDYCEANILENVVGGFITNVEYQSKCLEKLSPRAIGTALQEDAAQQSISKNKVISTDPPYYDNIAYADLSDFFYVWLRRTLRSIYPDLFSTMATPKSEELVATPYRHGTKEEAEMFFLNGMTKAIKNLAQYAHPAYPVTIYYAFKQSETREVGTASTGWETFLEAVLKAGFVITGTWPMRSEQSTRMIGMGTNALASSIVLVCRKRKNTVESISRRQFQRQLREEMPEALEAMIGGSEAASPIAPVDLAQATIGPGMGIFSRYKSILNQDGSKMSVHDALILINRAITDYLNPDSGNFDNDTLFCDSWFAEYGWAAGKFGQANTLAQAKGTTVDGVKEAGVIESGQGKVRLLKWQEYPTDWDPKQDNRTPVWEAMHHLIRAINQQGESGAGALLSRMPERGESIRQLAYHLYTLCERNGWADDARAYNELITAWHAIVAASHDVGHVGSQTELEI